MLGYRKRSFESAHQLLRRLQEAPNDFDALRSAQILLLHEIVRAERNIRRLKAEARSLASAGASKRAVFLKNRIEGLRRCTYIWRCFGDAIAFTYLDKHALKQTFFNTENWLPKQSAGFIADKEGLHAELDLVDKALAADVPAMLVDLTNTIRYGDVCLLGSSDPYLIEVKTSKSKNRRVARQLRDLQKLSSFYQKDFAKDFRGQELRRANVEIPEVTYLAEINNCITEAMVSGYSIARPEPGLTYLAVAGDAPIGEIMPKIGFLSPPLTFFLNVDKTEHSWQPYFPFTLSIEKLEHLWAFLEGQLVIVVFVDPQALVDYAETQGYQARWEDTEGGASFVLTSSDGESHMAISPFFIGRFGLDFSSPRWAIQTTIERLRLLKEGAAFAER